MPRGRDRNRQRAIARQARPKPWGELPRGFEPVQGLLLVDKDAGVTSHDIVGAIRRLGATRQVGHAGTLDPMATGLVAVAAGRTTKLIQYLVGANKTYTATICLGIGSSTDDADGQLYPVALTDFDEARLETAMAALTGEIMQVPASVSAIKVDGERAHDLVRAGTDFELAARPVHVAVFERTSQITYRELELEGKTYPCATFEVRVEVSSGTYVRALARDLGRALGTAAHLSALRRTRIGAWDVEQAKSVRELKETVLGGAPLPVLSLAQVCREVFQSIEIDAAEAKRLQNGLFIEMRDFAAPVRYPLVAFHNQTPIALVSARSGQLKPDLQLVDLTQTNSKGTKLAMNDFKDADDLATELGDQAREVAERAADHAESEQVSKVQVKKHGGCGGGNCGCGGRGKRAGVRTENTPSDAPEDISEGRPQLGLRGR